MLALVMACAGREAQTVQLVLGAASDLAPALPELTAAFEAETGIRVVTTIAASGVLAQQIINGAPIDVFASADRARIEDVARAGRLVAGTEAVYAYGRLVLYSPASGAGLSSIEDLRREDVTRIVIANPESAPYGMAARRALGRAGLWQALQPKIVIAENVRQTLQIVEAGGADAALTSFSIVRAAGGSIILLPDALHGPLEQVLGVIAGRPHEAEARALARFITGEPGRTILRGHGFELPDTDAPVHVPLPGPSPESR